MSLLVKFNRIGRNHRPPSLSLDATLSADEVSEAIYRHARQFLGSREVEVYVERHRETGALRGAILVGGFRNAGEFTVTEADR